MRGIVNDRAGAHNKTDAGVRGVIGSPSFTNLAPTAGLVA
jgi:hypothetical protein